MARLLWPDDDLGWIEFTIEFVIQGGDEAMLEEQQRRILEVLRAQGEKMTLRDVHDALDREMPENVIAVALGELTRKNLVRRRATPRHGRKRATQYYEAVAGPLGG